jgi:hypothetical protein
LNGFRELGLIGEKKSDGRNFGFSRLNEGENKENGTFRF